MRFDDEEVDAVYETVFGEVLFNAYTLKRERSNRLYFSQRLLVIRRMIRAMLDAEEELAPEPDTTPRPGDAPS
jgi:hypothetical protein